jgi:hypothetical protein
VFYAALSFLFIRIIHACRAVSSAKADDPWFKKSNSTSTSRNTSTSSSHVGTALELIVSIRG